MATSHNGAPTNGHGPGAARAGRADAPVVFLVAGQPSAEPFAGAAGVADAAGAAGRTRERAGEAGAAPTPGTLKQGVRLAAQRSGGALHRLQAVPGEDIVALHIAGGPVLWLHPHSARDLLRAQSPDAATRGGAAGAVDEAAPVTVGPQLRWHGLERAAPTRGRMGEVLLAAIEVFTGRLGGGGLADRAADLVTSEVLRRVDGQVEAGLYALDAAMMEGRLKDSGRRVPTLPAADGPSLVLVHGTFVETTSTFKKLWTEHPARVRELFTHYGGRVYALEHPTLAASPIANALTLARACPKRPDGRPVRLHLLTHSRGGLVAEVLARMAHQRSLGAADFAFFAGDALASQRQELRELAAEIAERHLVVERVVRVACPARGTLLASKRLDAYLSVLRWTLQLVRVPVAPALVDFLAEVARRRADPQQIPGLAAMIPDAPLLRWLNEGPEPIAGDLYAIAGDLRGEGIGSWVKTLLADAFYWGDNDIVVHTRAMYAGTPRQGSAAFLLDQGGEVTHFNYFANERTAAAAVQALTLPAGAAGTKGSAAGAASVAAAAAAQPPGFAPIGPLSWRGEDAGGLRGRPRDADPKRPAVFVLPGILGSALRSGPHRVWVGLRLVAGLDRLAWHADGSEGIADDGPLGMVYDDLIEFLGRTHEVIPFGFDWRVPIEQEARRLAGAIDAALDARAATGTPVQVIAHSMGGLVARTMQLERPATWARWLAHPDARLVMLGTPNGGSWAPMQVLSGDDTLGNLLAVIGKPFSNGRSVMAGMPGFLQLQAGLGDERLGLARSERWRELAGQDFARLQEVNWWHRASGEAAQEAAYRWGVPPQDVLDRALALRRRLDLQVERDLAGFADRLLLVVGRARFTPHGFDVGTEGFAYLDAVEGGDGRVPLDSALLPGVRTWTVDIEHGSLASKERVFAAYRELLQKGETTLLAALAPAVRGGAELVASAGAGTGRDALAASAAMPLQHVRSRPGRQLGQPMPPRSERDLGAEPMRAAAGFAADADADAGRPADAAGAPAAGRTLVVTVHNGDLSFVRQPLMIGHYCALKLSGAEAVLDGMLGGAMSASLASGLYPEAPGSVQVFGNTWRDPANPWAAPHPRAAIVVGLGDEGQLTAAQLAMSARQGAIAWAQRAAEGMGGAEGGSGAPATLELAATLMGSGGVGIHPGDAACAIVEGVHEANRRLAAAGWPVVTSLKLIELFLDRAGDAWRALRMLRSARPEVCALASAIGTGPGARRRLPASGYRGADYDLVRVCGTSEDGRIEFSLDTQRARSEVRAEQTQGTLVRELVARGAQHGRHDGAFGRTLFQLLVPQALEPFFAGTAQMVIDLDERTAPIPWELLDTAAAAGGGIGGGGGTGGAGLDMGERPWALRSRLLRKLRTVDFAGASTWAPRDARADDAVLVVGEPLAPAGYAPLPGARAEAEAVFAVLAGTGGLGGERAKALIGAAADAPTVVGALLARPWRIVHVAGHGEPPEPADPQRQPRGVVLSGGVFLGPNEIRKMRAVPELVFVNCCHLAARDARSTLADRPLFAAGVAEALIRLGVRCVVAAGWAVDDEPAAAFAAAFYASLLAGEPFIEAVAAGRERAWQADPGGNTWAAYQCYGDPGWTYRERTGDAQGARARAPALASPAAEFDDIASPVSLAQALEDLAIVQQHQGGHDEAERQRRRDALGDRLHHLQARFADPQGALRWGDIGAVAEAFGLAWEAAGERTQALEWLARAIAAEDGSASMKAAQRLNNLRARQAELRTREAMAAVARAGAGGRSAAHSAALAKARAEIGVARDELARLAALHPSIEGHALVGSANKRLALACRRAGLAGEAQAALAAAITAYGAAEALASERGSGDFYPALNRLTAELVLHADNGGARPLPAGRWEALRRTVSARHAADPDFWSATALVELDLYEAAAARRLAQRRDALLAALADVYRRRDDAPSWESVATQADFVLGALFEGAGSREAGGAAEAAAARALHEVLKGYARAGAGDEPPGAAPASAPAPAPRAEAPPAAVPRNGHARGGRKLLPSG